MHKPSLVPRCAEKKEPSRHTGCRKGAARSPKSAASPGKAGEYQDSRLLPSGEPGGWRLTASSTPSPRGVSQAAPLPSMLGNARPSFTAGPRVITQYAENRKLRSWDGSEIMQRVSSRA